MELFTNEYLKNTFLYLTGESYHYSFRVEVWLKDEIDGTVLRHALDKAAARFPYFCLRTCRIDGKLEIVHNSAPIPLRHGSTPWYLGSEEADGHFIGLCYDQRVIYFDVYHGMTDGTGFFPFLKLVLYHYCCEFYSRELDPTGFALDAMRKEEYLDPFAGLTPAAPLGTPRPEKPLSLADNGVVTPGEGRFLVLRVNETELMDYARSNDGSPNAIVSALMYKAVLRVQPDAKAPVICGIAANRRPAYGNPPCFYSLSTSLSAKYPSRLKDYSILSIATMTRGMVMLQSQPENFLSDIARHGKLNAYLSTLSDDHAKRELGAKMVLQGLAASTLFISYVGRSNWGSIAPYIDRHFSLANPGSMLLGIEIKLAGGNFYLCCSQLFPEDTYIRNFMDILREEGIACELERNEPLTLPKVMTF